MAHTIDQLLDAHLVERRADPVDGRQMLIDISAPGADAMDAFRTTADAWVEEAVASRLSDAERRTLVQGIALMRRLVGE